jgi:hypothetical protein
MKREVLAKAIESATSKNIVIFDSDAKAGEFTPRLVDLLNTEISGFAGLIVSESAKIDNDTLLAYRYLAIFRMTQDEHAELLKYYFHWLDGSLASGDKSFGLAIDDKFEFTLFSY